MKRLLACPLVMLGLAACGSDDSSGPTTTERQRASVLEGTEGSDAWTLALTPQDDGFCLSLEIDPPVRSPIVLGRAAALPSSEQRASTRGDSCIGQQLESDPQSMAFEPVFAPFIYERPEYRRPVIAGAASQNARDLELELRSGETTPVSVGEGGLFVEFPDDEVVAVRLTLDGHPWRCESGSLGVGPCQKG